MNAIPPPRPPHPPQASTLFVQVGRHGACIDLLAPDWAAVSLADIATSLARLPRWCGNTRSAAYSVAQHSVMVAAAVLEKTDNRWLAQAALLHDAHESAIGDIPIPVKRLVAGIEALERRLQDALFRRFGLLPALLDNDAVRCADLRQLATERRDFLAPSAWPWGGSLPPAATVILSPWAEARAYALFLDMAARLEVRG